LEYSERDRRIILSAGDKGVDVPLATDGKPLTQGSMKAGSGAVSLNAGPVIDEMNAKIDALTRLVVVQAKMMKVLMEKQGAHMAPTESSNGHAEESKPKPAAPTDETAAGNDMSNNPDYLARRRSSADRVSNELDQLINNTAIVVS